MFHIATINLPDGQPYRFDRLNLAVYESVISDKYPETLDDAQSMFSAIKSWLERFLEKISKDGDVLKYADYTDSMTDIYVKMAFFYPDMANKCKIIRRCINLFEGLLVLLDENLHVSKCQEVSYKLAQLYEQMLDFKIKMFGQANPLLCTQKINKIKGLGEKSLVKYERFIASSEEDADDGRYERLILAHLSGGRLCTMLAKLDDRLGQEKLYNLKGVRFLEEMQRLMRSAGETLQNRLKEETHMCAMMLLTLSLPIKVNLGENSGDSE